MSWQYLLITVIDLYTWIVLAYCILTWIPPGVGGTVLADVRNFLAKLVEPFLRPFQKIIPPIGGMVDITPIIAFFVLQLLERLILSLFSWF